MSSIANKMALMGYMRAEDRPGCRNCPSVHKTLGHHAWETKHMCKPGGFYVHPNAICDEHPAMKPVAEKVSA